MLLALALPCSPLGPAGVVHLRPCCLACPDTLPLAGCSPLVVRPVMGDCYHILLSHSGIVNVRPQGAGMWSRLQVGLWARLRRYGKVASYPQGTASDL